MSTVVLEMIFRALQGEDSGEPLPPQSWGGHIRALSLLLPSPPHLAGEPLGDLTGQVRL